MLPQAGVTDLIPGQETKILHATWHGQKNEQTNQKTKNCFKNILGYYTFI